MRSDPTALRLAVLPILQNWEYHDWSVQGFGVLRLYIYAPFPGYLVGGQTAGLKRRSIGRLHIWDSALRYPNVSMVHNHSWDLKSTIACGKLVNERFELAPPQLGYSFQRQRLLTGYASKMAEEQPESVWLLNQPKETYLPGECYYQHAHEIHQTLAEDGTVTLMARQEDEQDGFADVFWPTGHTWGTAKPRPATPDEIHATVFKALKRLEAEL